MASSSFTILPVNTSSSKNLSEIKDTKDWQLIFLVALFFLGVSIFFVPEKPDHFASICEKYNSGIACQVW